MTLEVKLHALHENVKIVVERGENLAVGNAKRGIRVWCWRRGDVGGKVPHAS